MDPKQARRFKAAASSSESGKARKSKKGASRKVKKQRLGEPEQKGRWTNTEAGAVQILRHNKQFGSDMVDGCYSVVWVWSAVDRERLEHAGENSWRRRK